MREIELHPQQDVGLDELRQMCYHRGWWAGCGRCVAVFWLMSTILPPLCAPSP
jgi:hypothetical protein